MCAKKKKARQSHRGTFSAKGNSREDLIAFNKAKERHGISAKNFHMGDATLREMADFLNQQDVGSLGEK